MVLEQERVTDMGGGGAFLPDITSSSGDDDPRELARIASVAFEPNAQLRPGVRREGTPSFGTIYNDEVHIDINRVPGDFTSEGMTPRHINVTFVSSLGWVTIDSVRGILPPEPEFADLMEAPTPEQARLIVYSALDAILATGKNFTVIP